MPNNAPKTDLLGKILKQFKVNCEVVSQLNQLLDHEELTNAKLYPDVHRPQIELAYIPDYSLLIRNGTLIMFYRHSTKTVYDISELLGKAKSGYQVNRFKDETFATQALSYRRI